MPRVLFIGIVVVGVMLGIIGFRADKDAFIINLLTEALGLLGSIVIGFTLVEYWTRRRSALEWSSVRSQTLYGVTVRLTEFLWDCYLAADVEFRKSSPDMVSLYTGDASVPETVEYANEIARYYKENAELIVLSYVDHVWQPRAFLRKARWVASKPRGHWKKLRILFDGTPGPLPDELVEIASGRAFCETSKATLGYIRDVYLPQLISSGDNLVLIEKLMHLEQKRLLWVNNAEVSEMSVVPHHGGWDTLPLVIHAVSDALMHLYSIGITETNPRVIEAVQTRRRWRLRSSTTS